MGMGFKLRSHVLATAIAVGMSVVATSAAAAVSSVAANSSAASADVSSLEESMKPGLLNPTAEPCGYSLLDAARITAAFNIGDHAGLPPAPFDGSGASRLQMLYITDFSSDTATFDVSRDTTLYVPVMAVTDGFPVIGTYPNVSRHKQVVDYMYAPTQIGLEHSIITIDGVSFPLSKKYLAATQTPTLPDGGGNYIASAAYLKPLSKGQHVVGFSFSATGDAVNEMLCTQFQVCDGQGISQSFTYIVNVH